MSHWLFSWQYWLVSKLLTPEVSYNLRRHNLIKFGICVLIIAIETVMAIGSIISSLGSANWRQKNRVADALRWTEPTFILIDSIVLISALWKTNKRFKEAQNLKSNEGYLCLHIILVILLVCSTFDLTLASDINDKDILVRATTYLTLNTASAFLWAFIMAQVSSRHHATILAYARTQKNSNINQTEYSDEPLMSEKNTTEFDQNSYISESANQEDDVIKLDTASRAEFQGIDYEVLTQPDDMGCLLYRVN